MSLNRTIILVALVVVVLGGCKMEDAAKVDYNRTGQSAGATCKATYDCAYPYVCTDGTCKKVGFEKEGVPPIEEPPNDVVWWPEVEDVYDDASSCCSPGDPCDWGNDDYCDCPGQDWDWSDCNGFEDVVWVDAYSPDYGEPDWIMVDLSEDDSGGCCMPWDPCGWANDGWCDCPGEGWDDDDCYGEPDIVEDFGCEPDCWGKECGADGCGGSCGHCVVGQACDGGECVTDSDGACTNEFDLPLVLSYEEEISDVAKGCSMDCLGTPDMVGCATPCVAEATGLTEECSACYVGLFGCTIDNCLAECVAAPDAPDCTDCMVATGCYDDFYACRGL